MTCCHSRAHFFFAMSLSKPAKTLIGSDVNTEHLDNPIKITSNWKVYLESKTKSRKSKKTNTVRFGRPGQHIISLEFYDGEDASDDDEEIREVLVWETENSNGKVATKWSRSKLQVVPNAQNQPLYSRSKKRTSNVLQHGSKSVSLSVAFCELLFALCAAPLWSYVVANVSLTCLLCGQIIWVD